MKKLLLASVLALGACSSTSQPAVTEAQVITDVNAFIVGAQQSLISASVSYPAFAASPGYAVIEQALTAAASETKALSVGMAASATAPVLQQVEAQINVAVAAAAAIPALPPQVSLALGMASVLLPEVEAFVNTVVPQPAPVVVAPAPVAPVASK